MDSKHPFHSRGTYLLMRLEYVALMTLCSTLLAMHWEEVNWPRFFLAFFAIDLVGYLPGALAARRLNGKAPAIFHYLYNLTHSFLTWLLLLTAWGLLADGWEWAMLAIPIHLSGDRGFFGNVFKPSSIPFEQGMRRRGVRTAPRAQGR